MKEIGTMDVISLDQAGITDLYDTMHHVDQSFCALFEGGSGVSYLGDVIPFDDAVVFAEVMSGRNAYHSFRDLLEQSSGMTYRQLFNLDRESVAALQRSLPTSTIEEVFRRAQTAKAAFQTTCRAFSAALRERLLKIKFDHGYGLSPDNLGRSWHTLCADHASLRHLVSDLRDSAWLDCKTRWRDLDQVVVDAIIAMRECFDWDQLTSHRSQGQSLLSWPLGTDALGHLEEVRTLLSRADAMWDSLRDELLRQADEDFEFYTANRVRDDELTTT